MAKTASGLHYLNSRKIIHRDMKAGNVLVTEQFEPVIADFGLSCNSSDDRAQGEGTLAYWAPELFDGDDYSPASDIYAFAMVMWFVATASEPERVCEEPWAHKSIRQLQTDVLEGERPIWPKEIKGEELDRFRLLTQRCWDQEAEQRPTIAEVEETLRVMAHEFPLQTTITAQASTIGTMITGDFPCQLCRVLMDECRANNLFSQEWNGRRLVGGVKLCHMNLTVPLSPPQDRLKQAALTHVLQSSNANSKFQERFTVRGVLAIHKPRAVNTLASQVVALSGRADQTNGWDGQGNPFRRTWHLQSFERFGETVSQGPEEIRWREAVSKRLKDAYRPVLASDPRCPWASVYTVFHACRDVGLAIKICETGSAVLASRDAGFYAQGLYFTLDLEYAVEQYGLGMLDADGNVTILVCDVAVGNVYPVIERPNDPREKSLKGRPQVPKYDAHFVCVKVEQGESTVCPPAEWG
eukprot:CAMPEP_0172154182 /NCGR_PEP_ID=MMETSP1050-20130122/1887_1 /TAXON_ID=233186 /ORGANISM="Cryptomonas curvata, Strain CCAP979/52" /LENGTH=467 /DNA_ID=CAMNT_0012822859 /DNA_START=201 /DNA_END=1600 /DNA_ORIENTATION=+